MTLVEVIILAVAVGVMLRQAFAVMAALSQGE